MAGILHKELGLKYGYTSFADWLWSAIAPVLGLKTIPDLLYTNSTHTGIAFIQLTVPHSCDYMNYAHHIGHAAKKIQNHM